MDGCPAEALDAEAGRVRLRAVAERLDDLEARTLRFGTGKIGCDLSNIESC